METQQQGWFSAYWQRNRIVFKGFLIAFLVLLLLIPTSFIQELIRERQNRLNEASEEISSKWAGSQTIAGPVICIPYIQTQKDTRGNLVDVKEYAYFLPEDLKITGSLQPEQRSRGIYKVIVYTSDINITGSFGNLDLSKLGIDAANALPEEAFVIFSLNDIRGIKEEMKLNLNGKTYELIPGNSAGTLFKSSLTAKINLSELDSATSKSFSMKLNLRGSHALNFQPFGKRTEVNLASTWDSPSFNGSYLPDSRTVSEKGFSANWKILYINRNYPQQWAGSTIDLEASSFGVDLLIPVDSYLKTERSVKYALLCIILTFTAFLLIELIYNKSIHAFQYILVGFALCLFYTLLLSISEYLGFNVSYLIAAVATIAMITIFVRSVFGSNKIATFIGLTLVFMYGFTFILIQSQDYALLMGSIGLFLILGLIMYFSRKAKLQ
ncbi:MAG: cell envelope integrity protein CreD [Flavitalea sp.]